MTQRHGKKAKEDRGKASSDANTSLVVQGLRFSAPRLDPWSGN